LFENIRGRTDHPVDTPQTNGVEEDNSSNYEIPCTVDKLDDQGSSVPSNMSNDDITVLSTKDLHECDPPTQESQPMTSAACTSLTTDTSELQEKSTMMNDKKEPTCSDKAVIATAEGDPEVVFTPTIQADLQPQLMAFTWPSTNKASKLEEQSTMTDDKQQPTCSNEAVIATKGEEAFCTIIQADIQPQSITSDVDKAYKLQEQSIMIDDEEEATCSGDAVIMGEDEKADCIIEDITSSVFEDVQNDITSKHLELEIFIVTVCMVGSVSDVGLTDYGMEAATDNIELLGYCNQFNGNMFDENITQYESMAEFETLYGQVS